MTKTEEEIYGRLASYCAQAERCVQDVEKKLRQTDLSETARKAVIKRLKTENFIDEKRYCRSFIMDKFRFNQWGRIKIRYELQQRGIPHETYREALELIDDEEYLSALERLLTQKKRSVKGAPNEAFQKLYRFAASRGFESNLIVNVLKRIVKNADYTEVIE
ncbi:MAG: RecX family transcriptional regulator [Tannerella sp.]|jgi:regulatory protein|nr:RecX family transcriptional regulator [Tannerella sp.]